MAYCSGGVSKLGTASVSPREVTKTIHPKTDILMTKMDSMKIEFSYIDLEIALSRI